MGTFVRGSLRYNMKLFLMTIVGISLIVTSEAGFRCTFGDWACSAGCVALGHSSGTCDDNDGCQCSERSISFAAFRNLLPSRCTLGLAFCKATCNAIGRKTGACVDGHGCECSSERLTPNEFLLCAAESTCRTDCQRKGKATGRCNGWQCECLSNTSGDSVLFADLNMNLEWPNSFIQDTKLW